MKPFAKAVVLGVLLLVTIYNAVHPQLAPVKANLRLDTILGALGGLFVLVLLIERATEIVISIWRQTDTDILKQAIELLAKDPARSADLATQSTALAAYQAETKHIALLVGFSLSVLACAGGIGILDTIIDTSKGADSHFLRGIDILLTAGLLAGGSDSVHQFVRALETVFQSAKKT